MQHETIRDLANDTRLRKMQLLSILRTVASRKDPLKHQGQRVETLETTVRINLLYLLLLEPERVYAESTFELSCRMAHISKTLPKLNQHQQQWN